MRNSAIFYKTFYDSIKTLKEKDQIKLYNAIFDYQFYFKETELSGITATLFSLIKPQLDANNKKYLNAISKKEPQDVENQQPKKSKREANEKQTRSKTEANEKQNESKMEANVNVNENNNVNENIIKEKPKNKKDKTKDDEKIRNIFNANKNLNKYKTRQLILYLKFLKKLSVQFPNIWNLKTQMTIDNYFEIHRKHSTILKEVLESMENYKGLDTRYNSVYLTLKNWCKKQIPKE